MSAHFEINAFSARFTFGKGASAHDNLGARPHEQAGRCQKKLSWNKELWNCASGEQKPERLDQV